MDLAVTGGEGPWGRIETLHGERDLERWLSLCSLAVDVVATPDDVEEAKRLRRSIWNSAEAVVDGGSPSAADVAGINEAAARPPLVPALEGGVRVWHAPRFEQALSDVARDAIALLSDPGQQARLRRCSSPDCELIFYDASRPGRRRWCSTERCGDRMRARAYRARHRA
ncbi:MAG TPA: CGNR zinc finger domain-containing protein [Solirubrobacteraceae bacterium]|nr:CGNR zinc finger domain-containing protein [Solirubrobacteraceae bacterium]